ncbi:MULTISPECIES: hypothetical protein [Spirulina sp. CCY15215]|uniref:hypothetical protein n=1 Tax=Spirulina sp. CCY15215 TaxID=2767591 RepID=UPI0019503E7D|nr:hypothetical protein [Spirulina major]
MKAKSTMAPLVFHGDAGGTIGFARFSEADSELIEESCSCFSDDDPPSSIAQFASEVMEDPLLMKKLGDRVYELMIEDLSNQRDRYGNNRGGLR